ncbi:MAG: hypothetical protein CMK09_05690 [Ponticaulis sp.]|nr:hypothetical protein [Ponticaulis sp.]|tara:strand:- start:42778 stop:43404 length:627 start_codon:yes stop_codon:yes gene_type:complete
MIKKLLSVLVGLVLTCLPAQAQQAIAWGVAVGEQPLGLWSTPFYSSPDLTSEPASNVRSGQMVEIYGTQSGWIYGGLDDGTKGYMPQQMLIVFSANLQELAQFDANAAQTLTSAMFNYRGYCFPEPNLAQVFDNSDCTTSEPSFSPNEITLINALATISPQLSIDYGTYNSLSQMSSDMHNSTMYVLETWGGRQCASYETPEIDNCYR